MARRFFLHLFACGVFYASVAAAQSVYTERPDDKLAVYLTKNQLGLTKSQLGLTKNQFGAYGDGVHDDAEALQQAIDRVQETTHQGLVFIPEGRYRLGRTIHVWAGIRLIGYGARRPVFLLAANTPGFQEGSSQYMLWFTDERPAAGAPIGDASEFTFWSAASNIDFELGAGNPAAVAIRFNVAQHSFLSHMNIHLGTARAAIEAVGNQASDLHIEGGQYGIITGKTSPAWQFLLMDSSLTGQSVAGIRTQEAGFTLVRDRFRNMPVAIEIPAGQVEQLYGRDLAAENISKSFLVAGDVENLRSEITLDNVACAHVARFAEGLEALRGGETGVQTERRTGKQGIADATPFFTEVHLSAGLEIGSDGRELGVVLHHQERSLHQPAAASPSDIPALPAMSEWVNVRSLGALGDGTTDDTAALQRAIDTHDTLYLPSGWYRLTRTLRLRPETRLIGLSPVTTQFTLRDASPEFAGAGPAIPLVLVPHAGRDLVSGIGISTGSDNPRAAGVEWLGGTQSMLDDVEFIRGHSRYNAMFSPAVPAPADGAARAPVKLDAQHASLWIHDGGGGIFRGLWSHAGTAQEGLLVEDTATPGSIYQFSCEHHLRTEVRFDHVSNWKVYALQTEEENPEGADAFALALTSSRNLLFANTYMYRVSRNVRPRLYAVLSQGSDAVVFANMQVFSQTRLAFDDAFLDQERQVAVRAHSFVSFTASPDLHPGPALPLPPVFAPGAKLTALAGGFSNASGLTADASGHIYFSDAVMHTVYRWNEEQRKAEVVAKVDGSPMVLGYVAPSTLLAIENERSVSEIEIATGAVKTVAESETLLPGTALLLPVGLHNELWMLEALLQHRGYIFRQGSNTARRSSLIEEHRGYFYAAGSDIAVLAGGTWRPLLQSAQLASFHAGQAHLLVSEDEGRTYWAELQGPQTLTTKLFAERGGTSVVSDENGNVYIAGSQVYIYDPHGHPIGVLEVPERPSSLSFGGADRRTLFIGARGSLYSIRTAAPGVRTPF